MIIVLPADIPVTIPVLNPIVATVISLLIHVPPVMLLVIVSVEPWQTTLSALKYFGKGFTVNTPVAETKHPPDITEGGRQHIGNVDHATL